MGFRTAKVMLWVILFGLPATAHVDPMPFQAWKEAQVAAVNRATIWSEGTDTKNQIHHLEALSERMKFATELTVDDYLAVHLTQFSGDEKSLREISAKSTQEDIHLLLKSLIKIYQKKRAQELNPFGSAPAPIAPEKGLHPVRH